MGLLIDMELLIALELFNVMKLLIDIDIDIYI